MPYSLLQLLSASQLPVKVIKKDQIDKVVALREAGLVVADTPQVLMLEGHQAYAGAAVVHSITPKGLSAVKRAND